MNLFNKFIKSIKPEIWYVIILFLVTRLVLTFIGSSSRIMLDLWHGSEYVWHYSKYVWLDIWGVWDTGYYLNIAENWYSSTLGLTTGTLNQANYVFFPLYPLLIKIFSYIFRNTYVTGLIISNTFLFISCIYLYKLVKLKINKEVALNSIKYLFLFPTAFILSGVFTESLFLALVIMIFYYAEKEKWYFVGLIGILITLTKFLGILVIIPLFYFYLKKKNFKISELKADLIYLILIPLGFVIYLFINYQLTGNFISFLKLQEMGWGHSLTNPLIVLYNNLITQDIFRFINSFFVISILIFFILKIKKIEFTYWLFSILFLITPLFSGQVSLNSMLRYVLPIFPLYILLAIISENKYYDLILTIILLLMQGFFMVFWSNGFHLIV